MNYVWEKTNPLLRIGARERMLTLNNVTLRQIKVKYSYLCQGALSPIVGYSHEQYNDCPIMTL